MGRKITRFQFETIKAKLEAGEMNWVNLRQACGLTSEELQEIIDNFEEYQAQFAEPDPEPPKKKHWWQR